MALLKQHSDFPDSLNVLTGEVMDCFYQVHQELGAGYTENIYEEACCIEFQRKGLSFEKQKSIPIFYKGEVLNNNFRLDLVVENEILIELKAVEHVLPVHQAQIYSYLKATKYPIGFLVNFNVSLIKEGVRRYVNKTPKLQNSA